MTLKIFLNNKHDRPTIIYFLYEEYITAFLYPMGVFAYILWFSIVFLWDFCEGMCVSLPLCVSCVFWRGDFCLFGCLAGCFTLF